MSVSALTVESLEFSFLMRWASSMMMYRQWNFFQYAFSCGARFTGDGF